MDEPTPIANADEPASDHVSLTRNVLSNWSVTALAIISTFVVTPVVVGALQKEQYGIWSFLNGLLVYSGLLYFGLGSALIKNVAAARAAGDRAGLNRTASVVLSIYAVLGLLCLLAFSFVSPLVPRVFAYPLTPGVDKSAVVTCVLLGVQLLFSFVGSAFSGVLIGIDRLDLINLVRSVSIVARTAAMLALLGGQQSLVILAAISTVGSVAEAIGVATFAFTVDRGLAIRPTVPNLAELKSLYGFGVQSFIIIFSVTLISYTDTTVIGVMLGAASVAMYSLPQQLVEYVQTAAAGATSVMLPRLTMLSARGDRRGLQLAYVRTARFTMFLSSFIVGNILFLGGPFLSLWVGPDFGGQVQWVILFLALGMLLHVFVVTVPLGFYQAMDTLGVPAIILLLEALANFALSMLLAPRLGITGVALGTFIPAAVVSGSVLAPYIWKKLGVPAQEVRQIVLPAVLLLLVTSSLHWVLSLFLANTSYYLLLAKSALTVPPAFLMAVYVFPAEDRVLLVAGVRGMWRLPTGSTRT